MPLGALAYHWAQGVRIDQNVMLPMPDGVSLATNVLRPWWRPSALPTILIRTPYGKADTGRGYARKGYAVVVQDMRGRHDSEGVFTPYQTDAADGAATMDWIVRQPWSNGRIGTVGCSAAGESQLVLAAAMHPAHHAMIAEGAGGGIGSAADRFAYFGVYEGGVFQLASAFGWFAQGGEKTPTSTRTATERLADGVRSLPVLGMVDRYRSVATDFDDFRRTPLGDPAWEKRGYLSDADKFSTPTLHVNNWYDQGVSDTLAAAALMSRHAVNEAARRQPVIIGPGLHCETFGAGSGKVGDITYENADIPFKTTYDRWLRDWLEGDGSATNDIPPYQVFVMGENRWIASSTWPPADAVPMRWHLSSAGAANSRGGDGVLSRAAPEGAPAFDRFAADPLDPVPTRGGGFCCTGDPLARQGPTDQRDVETRCDVLVYTSAPLTQSMRIAGPVALAITVASSAADTDFIAKLVDVHPDGRAILIQQGALRLRYRDGFRQPQRADPGERYAIRISMRDIAWRLPAGHRLRVLIAGSDFPRLERNLNTGGNNYDEKQGVVAENKVFHGAGLSSYLQLSVLDKLP